MEGSVKRDLRYHVPVTSSRDRLTRTTDPIGHDPRRIILEFADSTRSRLKTSRVTNHPLRKVLYDRIHNDHAGGELGYVHVNAPFNLVRGRHIGAAFQLGAA